MITPLSTETWVRTEVIVFIAHFCLFKEEILQVFFFATVGFYDISISIIVMNITQF